MVLNDDSRRRQLAPEISVQLFESEEGGKQSVQLKVMREQVVSKYLNSKFKKPPNL